MQQIYSSASKIVFILMALTVCVSLFFGKIEAKDFMVLAAMAFSFYFTKTTPLDNQNNKNETQE